MARSPNSPRAIISASRSSPNRIRSPVRILRPGRTSASQSRPSAETGRTRRTSTSPDRYSRRAGFFLPIGRECTPARCPYNREGNTRESLSTRQSPGPEKLRQIAQLRGPPSAIQSHTRPACARRRGLPAAPARSGPGASGSRIRKLHQSGKRATACHLPITRADTRPARKPARTSRESFAHGRAAVPCSRRSGRGSSEPVPIARGKLRKALLQKREDTFCALGIRNRAPPPKYFAPASAAAHASDSRSSSLSVMSGITGFGNTPRRCPPRKACARPRDAGPAAARAAPDPRQFRIQRGDGDVDVEHIAARHLPVQVQVARHQVRLGGDGTWRPLSPANTSRMARVRP